MKEKLNRLNDVFFKYLLGDAKKKSLTLSFINGILNRTDENRFVDLDFLDKELTPIIQAGKVSVLDIRAKMNDGTQVNIEVQVYKDPDMTKRSLYYWSKMYSSELHEGDPYSKLVQAISINLMDFNAFPAYATCHHSYHIYNDETHDRLLDDLELHFIELEKIRIGDIRKLRKSEQWIAYFSNQCSDEEREVLAMSEPAIKEAMQCEMYFTQDEKLRRQYEIQEKARRDYISLMDNLKNSHQRGVEEGIQQGIQQGIEQGIRQGIKQGIEQGIQQGIEQGIEQGIQQGIEQGIEQGIQQGIEQGRKLGAQQERAKADQEHALAMIQEGFSYNVIAKVTGLSLEKIKEIAEKNE